MGLIIDDLQVETSLTGSGVTSSLTIALAVEKGSPNGICELDALGFIPISRVPNSLEEVLEFANLAAFPLTGVVSKLYVALDTNLVYRWSGSVYVVLGNSQVQSVFGRTGNVIAQNGDYTATQVGADASGSAASAQAFSIQRSNHSGSQQASTISDFEPSVLATNLLSVVTTATESKVVAADTILQSVGKIQGQLNLYQEKFQATQLTNSSNVTLTNIGDLAFSVVAGKRYRIQTMILYRSTATATGIALTAALTSAVGTLALTASIPVGGDGTASVFNGSITASADIVTANATPTANLDFVAQINGIFVCTTSGTITPQFRSETNGTTVTVQIGSNIIVREF